MLLRAHVGGDSGNAVIPNILIWRQAVRRVAGVAANAPIRVLPGSVRPTTNGRTVEVGQDWVPESQTADHSGMGDHSSMFSTFVKR
mgnify:FL=1